MNPYIIPGLKSKANNLKRIVSVESIRVAVCNYYGMDMDTIRTKCRTSLIVQSRYVMCYMLRKHTDMSLVDVAHYLSPGITDHTTVMHGIAYVKGQLEAKHENTIKIVLNEIYI